jgi:hypothetical protein
MHVKTGNVLLNIRLQKNPRRFPGSVRVILPFFLLCQLCRNFKRVFVARDNRLMTVPASAFNMSTASAYVCPSKLPTASLSADATCTPHLSRSNTRHKISNRARRRLLAIGADLPGREHTRAAVGHPRYGDCQKYAKRKSISTEAQRGSKPRISELAGNGGVLFTRRSLSEVIHRASI